MEKSGDEWAAKVIRLRARSGVNRDEAGGGWGESGGATHFDGSAAVDC